MTGLVSCGSTRLTAAPRGTFGYGVNYTDGCNGAYSALTMDYLIDYGATWASCFPYSGTGSGNWRDHFSSVDAVTQECVSDCVPSFRAVYPDTPIQFFKGLNRQFYTVCRRAAGTVCNGLRLASLGITPLSR